MFLAIETIAASVAASVAKDSFVAMEDAPMLLTMLHIAVSATARANRGVNVCMGFVGTGTNLLDSVWQ